MFYFLENLIVYRFMEFQLKYALAVNQYIMSQTSPKRMNYQNNRISSFR